MTKAKQRIVELRIKVKTNAPTDALIDRTEWQRTLWYDFSDGQYNFTVQDVIASEGRTAAEARRERCK